MLFMVKYIITFTISRQNEAMETKKIREIREIRGFIPVFKSKTRFSPPKTMSLAVSKCQ
jgi:hypothetical protein